MSSPAHQNFTGRFPPDVLEALRSSARQHDRSLNAEINRAVRYYLAAMKPKPKPASEEAVS